MHEIVADTAPLNYLVLIEAIGILARLFASVLIPPAVKKELSHGNAPAADAARSTGSVQTRGAPFGVLKKGREREASPPPKSVPNARGMGTAGFAKRAPSHTSVATRCACR